MRADCYGKVEERPFIRRRKEEKEFFFLAVVNRIDRQPQPSTDENERGPVGFNSLDVACLRREGGSMLEKRME